MNIQVERWNEDSLPDPAELKSRLLREGYSVFQWSDAPGTKYGPHSHGEDQSHWIVSGALDLIVGHETYTLRRRSGLSSREHYSLGACSRQRAGDLPDRRKTLTGLVVKRKRKS